MPSVLLVGLEDRPENQFTRNLKKLNVDFEHITGDPGPFRNDHDAAILIKGNVAHRKFWDVKEVYGGKRLFVATHSFSEIREAFSDFVFKFDSNKIVIEPIKTNIIEATVVKDEPIVGRLVDFKFTNRERIVKECDEAGMKAREAIEMLHAEGEKIESGRSFNVNDVYNIRMAYKKKMAKAFNTDKTAEPKLKTIVKKADKSPVKVPDNDLSLIAAEPSLIDATALIRMVLNSTLPQALKLARIEMITAGKITKAKGCFSELRADASGEFLYIEKFDIAMEHPIAQLGLSRGEAQLAVESAESISNFALGIALKR